MASFRQIPCASGIGSVLTAIGFVSSASCAGATLLSPAPYRFVRPQNWVRFAIFPGDRKPHSPIGRLEPRATPGPAAGRSRNRIGLVPSNSARLGTGFVLAAIGFVSSASRVGPTLLSPSPYRSTHPRNWVRFVILACPPLSRAHHPALHPRPPNRMCYHIHRTETRLREDKEHYP